MSQKKSPRQPEKKKQIDLAGRHAEVKLEQHPLHPDVRLLLLRYEGHGHLHQPADQKFSGIEVMWDQMNVGSSKLIVRM